MLIFGRAFFWGGGGTGACYRNFTAIRLVKRMPKISVNRHFGPTNLGLQNVDRSDWSLNLLSGKVLSIWRSQFYSYITRVNSERKQTRVELFISLFWLARKSKQPGLT